MQTLSTILAGFLIALMVVACEKVPELRPLPADAVILAFGDSLTHGNGAGQGEDYPRVLAGMLDRKVINAGVPGEVSAAGLQRLPSLLAELHPDLVILCHGGNDFLQRLDRNKTAANLAAMVAEVQSQGAEVVLVGVPEPGLFLSPPEFYRELAQNAQIPYEGRIVSELLGDNHFKSDAIHPNALGYRRLAEALYTLMKRSHAL